MEVITGTRCEKCNTQTRPILLTCGRGEFSQRGNGGKGKDSVGGLIGKACRINTPVYGRVGADEKNLWRCGICQGVVTQITRLKKTFSSLFQLWECCRLWNGQMLFPVGRRPDVHYHQVFSTFWTVRHRLFLSPEHKPSDSKETGAAAAVSPKSRLEASVSHQLALTAHAGLP